MTHLYSTQTHGRYRTRMWACTHTFFHVHTHSFMHTHILSLYPLALGTLGTWHTHTPKIQVRSVELETRMDCKVKIAKATRKATPCANPSIPSVSFSCQNTASINVCGDSVFVARFVCWRLSFFVGVFLYFTSLTRRDQVPE